MDDPFDDPRQYGNDHEDRKHFERRVVVGSHCQKPYSAEHAQSGQPDVRRKPSVSSGLNDFKSL